MVKGRKLLIAFVLSSCADTYEKTKVKNMADTKYRSIESGIKLVLINPFYKIYYLLIRKLSKNDTFVWLYFCNGHGNSQQQRYST